jgi:predicted AAA+ superfamily ATPase
MVDLRTLHSKPHPKRILSLINALSRNIGTTASYETLSKETDIRVERHTIRKYLDQLSQTFILDELLP